MPVTPLALALRSNPGRFPQAGSARLINGYAEAADDEGRSKWPVWASDGLTNWLTLGGTGGVRAMMPVGYEMVVVAGRLIHTVLADGTSAIAGDLPTDGPVYMAYNGSEVGIVSDGVYKVWAGGAVTEISDPDLIGPTSIDFIDQYMIFSQADGRWGWSELGNARLIDALDYVTAESNPDPVTRVMRHQRNVVAAGPKSFEWWSNTGSATSVFERVTATDVGVIAPGSMAVVDQTIAFVAHDKTVRLLNGYQVPRISTHAVERWIAGVAEPERLTATSWTGRGHTFYALSDASATWVYDLTTSYWHERASYGMDRWRVHQAVEFGGRWIVGDYASPKLYVMSSDAYDEAGDELVMRVQLPAVHAFPDAVTFDALDIDVVPGLGAHPGTGAAQDVDPEIMVRWSDDGGISWGGERRVSTGRMGETVKRVRTTRLGTCRQIGRTFEISASTKTAKGLLGVSATVAKAGR